MSTMTDHSERGNSIGMRRHFRLYSQVRLLIRMAMFLGAAGAYRIHRETFSELVESGWFLVNSSQDKSICALLTVIWCLLFAGMVGRYFPSRLESMGCQKEFGRFFRRRQAHVPDTQNLPDIQNLSDIQNLPDTRYLPDMRYLLEAQRRREDQGAGVTFAVWFGCNVVIYGFYFAGILDAGQMLLLCLFYAVCDMICILIFCPFRAWIMKNRCCTVCRIYNWDYLMMMTPVLVTGNGALLLLDLLALGLFLRWEWTWRRHPERFLELTNENLSCGRCEHPKSCAGCVRRGSFFGRKSSGLEKFDAKNRKTNEE